MNNRFDLIAALEITDEEISVILSRRVDSAYNKGYDRALSDSINIVGGVATASLDDRNKAVDILKNLKSEDRK